MQQNTITIVEVGPRDGLQSETRVLPTETKVELVRQLVDAGLRKIEVASFVNPGRVPQMADADQLMAELPREDGLVYVGLVMNQRGFERAIAAGIDEVGFVVVASDTFNRRNQGVGTEESITAFGYMAEAARDAGVAINVTISSAFGCPFEGLVEPARVVEIAEQLMRNAPCALGLADTIGVATPWQVGALLRKLSRWLVRPRCVVTFTTHATQGLRMRSPLSKPVPVPSMPASGVPAVARSRPGQPVTLQQRTWSTCCAIPVSIPRCQCRSYSPLLPGWVKKSVAHYPEWCPEPVIFHSDQQTWWPCSTFDSGAVNMRTGDA